MKLLVCCDKMGDTGHMDAGEIALTGSKLVLGAIACFLAIVLWSKTRDIAWMLVVISTIASYAQTVYSILDRFGMIPERFFMLGTVPIASLLLESLPLLLLMTAFSVMIARKSRR